MIQSVNIGIIGDYNQDFRPHQATNTALKDSAQYLGINLEFKWLPTLSFEEQPVKKTLQEFDALWCAPGSPYQSMNGALKAIQFARESQLPLIGTCGGFQHIVIEYARNILGFQDAEHAEYDPYASRLFISKLSCSLVGKTMKINLNPNSQIGQIYQNTVIQEKYYCNFGLNPNYQNLIDKEGLKVVGIDENGEARVLELPNHPFFIATLFVPQLSSSAYKPHPLISSYLETALSFKT